MLRLGGSSRSCPRDGGIFALTESPGRRGSFEGSDRMVTPATGFSPPRSTTRRFRTRPIGAGVTSAHCGDAPKPAGRVSAKASPMAHASCLLIDDSFRCDALPESVGARRAYRECSWFARPFGYWTYLSTWRPELAGNGRRIPTSLLSVGFGPGQLDVDSSTNSTRENSQDLLISSE